MLAIGLAPLDGVRAALAGATDEEAARAVRNLDRGLRVLAGEMSQYCYWNEDADGPRY